MAVGVLDMTDPSSTGHIGEHLMVSRITVRYDQLFFLWRDRVYS